MVLRLTELEADVVKSALELEHKKLQRDLGQSRSMGYASHDAIRLCTRRQAVESLMRKIENPPKDLAVVPPPITLIDDRFA